MDTTLHSKMIQYVYLMQGKVEGKHKKVLQALGIKEQNAWGDGLLIFCAKKTKG